MRKSLVAAASLFALLAQRSPSAKAATLTVGPGKTFAKPCDAIAAAQPGDVIDVDAAGSYDGDHCAWSTDGLTVRGVGGRARIDAGGNLASIAEGKGIFVIHAPTATVESFELSGAVADPGSANGAGIRHQGTDLTVRDCLFHDDQDGILGAPAMDGTGSVTIERSEFRHNGAGDGQSHNMYLNHYARFTLLASYSHGAVAGHLVKSRALENHILYNRLTDEPGTTASYEIDLPNGGLSFVIGNLVEQSAESQNGTILDFAEEGATNPDQHLFVVSNTIVNDRSGGTFLAVAVAQPAAVIVDNLFVGSGTITTQAGATLTTNFDAQKMGDPRLVDAAGFDYHLAAGSPAIGAGSDPGSGAGQPLAPSFQYVHPTSVEPRAAGGGAMDIGAYAFRAAMTADGSASRDGGGTLVDGGGALVDGGGKRDAGAGAAMNAGGCGCHVGQGGGVPSRAHLFGAALLLLGAAARRRGRPSSRRRRQADPRR